MSLHHQTSLGDLTIYMSPLTAREQLILGHVPSWVDEASEEAVLAHADVEAEIAEVCIGKLKEFFELVKKCKDAEDDGPIDELNELGDSLSPREIATIKKVKFLRNKRDNLLKTIGAHAMHGQMMTAAVVVKDVEGAGWPMFGANIPPRKVVNQRAEILGNIHPRYRDKMMDAVTTAIEAGIAGLTDEEKKS